MLHDVGINSNLMSLILTTLLLFSGITVLIFYLTGTYQGSCSITTSINGLLIVSALDWPQHAEMSCWSLILQTSDLQQTSRNMKGCKLQSMLNDRNRSNAALVGCQQHQMRV